MGSGIIWLLFLGIFWIPTSVALQSPQLPALLPAGMSEWDEMPKECQSR